MATRFTQDAWVQADDLHLRDTDMLQGKGARLFVTGTVEEASWDRSDAEGGRYRLKVALSISIGRMHSPDLRDFWTKEVTADVPHRAWGGPELAAAVEGVFGGAVAADYAPPVEGQQTNV